MHTALQRSGITAAKAAVGLVISGSGLLMFALPAFAGVGVGVAPNFPGTVTVGQTGIAVSMDITNSSNGGVTNIDLSNIRLIPSCGDTDADSTTCTTVGEKDPGVFTLSSTATGANACTGINFTEAINDATTGQYLFTPSATITLAVGATCTINFTAAVNKVPTNDSSASAGLQTLQIGKVTGTQTGGELNATGAGSDQTTVNKASPSITTTLSTTTPVKIGTSVHDSATLTGATSTPGGTATYSVFSNSSCNLGTTTAGTVVVTNGVVPDSNSVQFNTAGTFYWQVVYSGDANNNPATSTCTSEILTVVAHPSTHLTKSPSATNVAPGTLVTYTYHEQNDGDVPLTAVSVTDNQCSPVVYSSGDTNANGILDPGETWNFTCSQTLNTTTINTAVGHGTYNGQDVTWNPQICSPTYTIGISIICNYNEVASSTVTVTKLTPTVTTNIHDGAHNTITSAIVGSGVHDNVVVGGTGPTPTGTVAFNLYTNPSCDSATTTQVVSLVSASAESGTTTVPATGLGYRAYYNGDVNYSPLLGACEPLQAIAQGHIIIDKVTSTSSTQSFHFTTTGTGYVAFDLTDAATPNDQTLNAGTYSVTEASTTGWIFNGASCSVNGGTAGPYTPGTPLTLNAGDTIRCTFNNSPQPPAGQYCSPGYWKQSQHFDSWKVYNPTNTFLAVFGRSITINWSAKGKPAPLTNPTLLQALQANGGGINLIAREAVDALENSETLTFGFTPAQVIAAVQAAIDANDPSLLDKFNLTENCPLN